jgi:uncharacterized protein (DUF2141 family)
VQRSDGRRRFATKLSELGRVYDGDMRIALLVTLAASLAHAEAPPTFAISGRVIGASGGHAVYVALWTADNFLQTPTKQLKFAPGVEPRFRFDVAPGRWAVSAYEDRNDNGVLDVGVFGPKEPSGFWRLFKAWRKPRFDDVERKVDGNIADAEVTLK